MPSPLPRRRPAFPLDRNEVNFAPLTPLTFLRWSAHACPNRPAVIHGSRSFTWHETQTRCRRLASSLVRLGIEPGDTVAAMLHNTPEMYELHFGVPMAGAVLNALNIRLDPDSIALMLNHGAARIVVCDREFSGVMVAAIAKSDDPPLVINVDDPEYNGPGTHIGDTEYEALLATGDPEYLPNAPLNEWDSIALNYTSGTTGNPKGVVYSHRGAYLNALANVLTWSMPRYPVYLWTLPMFHCNGWCFPWSVAAVTGTNICMRKWDAASVFRLIRHHGVTHYCGAPIVHTTLMHAPPELRDGISHTVRGMVAGAAPPSATLAGMERIGIDLTHVYGLTEVYGPATVCVKQQDWHSLPLEDRAARNGRQGIRYLLEEETTVLNPESMRPVPWDGHTIGEIMFRGNIMMKGYLNDPEATAAAFAGGWFHSGDLAVMDADGYMKIRDRSKDVIISGGENISSLEVEDVICRHPSVMAAAVVAQPDPKWGETPCAFVELTPGAQVTERELIDHCRSHLAHYKAPATIVFGQLPKTATGKVRKFALRARAKSASAIE